MNTPTPLKVSDVLRFLAAKNVTLKCATCGGGKFDFLNESRSAHA